MNEKDFTTIQMNAHSYKRKKLGCPCPGIAILINHGYLTPTDAHSRIKITELIKALIECYNLTWFHSIFLSILTLFLCGKKKKLSVSIAELGVHGKIEHDGSISRYDWGSGDSLNPNENLINEFLNTSDPQQVSLNDYADRRTELVSYSHETWSLKTCITALGEVGLTVAIFGDGERFVNSSSLRTMFMEEKLPQGWQRPKKPISMMNVIKVGWELNQKIKSLSKKKRNFTI